MCEYISEIMFPLTSYSMKVSGCISEALTNIILFVITYLLIAGICLTAIDTQFFFLIANLIVSVQTSIFECRFKTLYIKVTT